MARLARSVATGARACQAWAWGVATMCLVRPVEGQVQVVVQWVVRTEGAVANAMTALRDTAQLQRALGDALANTTGQAVRVQNVTARMLDTSAKPGGGTAPSPTPTGEAAETDTMMMAAVGGLALVGVAWVMSRRPWAAPGAGGGGTGNAARAGVAPVIRVRLRRA